MTDLSDDNVNWFIQSIGETEVSELIEALANRVKELEAKLAAYGPDE